MTRILIDVGALRHNLSIISKWMTAHGAGWTAVTKSLCGHHDTLKALHQLGVTSMGDSRLDNLKAIRAIDPNIETWHMRVPNLSTVRRVVELAHVSLNSEIGIIEALNEQARQNNKIVRIIIMIELGDLREGILPGSLTTFYRHVFELANIEVLGIGANLGCLSGVVPTVDQLMQLILYRELLELKFQKRLQLISAGSTATLPLLISGKLPTAINHFRIGEAIFLGTDLINGGTLRGLRNDVMLLETEIAEIKEKCLTPMGETAPITPFKAEDEQIHSPGQRGYRALVTVGQLDTDVAGLTPVNTQHRIAGSSSDLTAINLGVDAQGLKVGSTIRFHVSYSALLRLMSTRYVTKHLIAADPPASARHLQTNTLKTLSS